MKLKSHILFLIFVVPFAFANIVIAEVQTFVRDYTYQASEADSKQSCRVIATEQVKRLLLEEIGTYLESHTEVQNYQLTKDQITTLTAGVVKTKILDEKWDGEKYWLKAKVDADPDDVAKSIEKLRQDRKKMTELEESRKKSDDAMKDMATLRKDMSADPNNKEKIVQYNEKVESLKMLQSMQDVFKAMSSGKPEQAIGSFFEMMGSSIQNQPGAPNQK